MVDLGPGSRFIVADIPGLIEGAHEGAGIGDRFLGHIERCASLIHLIDGTQEDPVAAYHTVRKELLAYGGGLESKAEIIVLNKTDAMTDEDASERAQALSEAIDQSVVQMSGVSGSGVKQLCSAAWDMVKLERADEVAAAAAAEAGDDEAPGWAP